MKLVKEYINEKFVEESDPIKDLGIGLGRKFFEKEFKIEGSTSSEAGSIRFFNQKDIVGNRLPYTYS